jgi:sporulation protein YlmC with PRC-barrel domain
MLYSRLKAGGSAMDVNIPVDAGVECTDGVCGVSTHVVINPISKKVTHLVVKEKDFPHIKRMVPVEWVTQTSSNLIQLECTKEKLGHQETFTETEYVKLEPSDIPPYPPAPFSGGAFMYWPYTLPESERYIPVEHEHVPPGELAVRRGTQVEATDGHVGRVDEFLVDPRDEHITHLIMREGHLWGQKDVSIPISAIEHIAEDTVYLKLSKNEIEALPTIPLRRRSL